MDFSKIIEELRDATPFDLYRLCGAIDRDLERPERIEQVRACLRPGMQIRYFDRRSNSEVDATVIELNRTRLLVENLKDGQRWSILFCSVNVNRVEVDLRAAPGQGGLDRSTLKVGDSVGYRDRQNRDTYGVVLQLNQKTVTVRTKGGETWRVAYSYLFPVLELGEDDK